MKLRIYDVEVIEFDGLSLMLEIVYDRKTKTTIFVDPSIPLRVVCTRDNNIAVELELLKVGGMEKDNVDNNEGA